MVINCLSYIILSKNKLIYSRITTTPIWKNSPTLPMDVGGKNLYMKTRQSYTILLTIFKSV